MGEHAQVVDRDRVLRDLRRLLLEHPERTDEAKARIRIRVDEIIEQRNRAKRDRVREDLALLEIAREMVLDPGSLMGASAIRINQEVPIDPELPKGLWPQGLVLVDGCVPVYAVRAWEALGEYDSGVERRLQNLRDWMVAAQTGQFGERRAKHQIDLSANSAVEAFVFANTVEIEGEDRRSAGTREEVECSLDPTNAEDATATPMFALADAILDLVGEPPDRQRSSEEWWDAAVLIETSLDPDAEALGLAPVDPDPDAYLGTFKEMTAWCTAVEPGASVACHEIASRALIWLSPSSTVEDRGEQGDVSRADSEPGYQARYFSIPEIMLDMNIPPEKRGVVKKRLERLRKRAPGDDKLSIESQNRSVNQPRFLYNLTRVRSELLDLVSPGPGGH